MNKIAIISDIHGNLPALEAVLHDIKEKGINDIFCLGDLVGYYCFHNEVVTLIRERNIRCLLGNHDFAIIKNKGVIERSKTCTKILTWQLETLTKENLEFLTTLPDKIEETIFEKNLFFVHAGLIDSIDEYIFDISAEYLEKNNFKQDVLIHGHTHLPNYKTFFNGKICFNPGSVGQPRNGDPRSSYLIIDSNWNFEFVKIAYNVDLVIQSMKSNGFEDYITQPLITGKKIGL